MSVIHAEDNTESELQALFDAVLRPCAHTERPVPLRMRNLPQSFFNQPASLEHAREHNVDVQGQGSFETNPDSAIGSFDATTDVQYGRSVVPTRISSAQCTGVSRALSAKHSRAHSSPATLVRTDTLLTGHSMTSSIASPIASSMTSPIASSMTSPIASSLNTPMATALASSMATSPREAMHRKQHSCDFDAYADYRSVLGHIVDVEDLEDLVADGLGPLPDGWEQAKTVDGLVYYLNHMTQTTTWNDPRKESEATKWLRGAEVVKSLEHYRGSSEDSGVDGDQFAVDASYGDLPMDDVNEMLDDVQALIDSTEGLSERTVATDVSLFDLPAEYF